MYGFSYKVVTLQNFTNITGRVLIQLLVVPKYDDCNINGAKNGELMRLLKEATFALQKGSAKALLSANIRVMECAMKHTPSDSYHP